MAKLAINYEMGNDEIIAQLLENEIEVTAEPVIIDIVESENPDWVMFFLMAEIKLKSGNTSLTKAQLRFKKFGESSQMLRAIEAVAADVAEDYKVGDVLEGMTFRIVDSLEKPHDKANPRQTKDGRLLVDDEGNKIYRQAVVVDTIELYGGVDEETGEEIVGLGHEIISCKPVVASSPSKSTRKREVLQS